MTFAASNGTQAPHDSTVSRPSDAVCGQELTQAVSAIRLSQYQRDLERVGEGECFFAAMGRLAAGALE